MTQIQKKVHEYIDSNIAIRRSMENDVISLRKLARHISVKLDLDADDAVLSAIRRYEIKESKNIYDNALEIVKKTKISTKSDIVSIAMEKSEEAQKILPKLFEEINFNRGEVLRIIQAESSIKIIIDNKNLAKIEKKIPKDKVISIEKDLAEINLHLDKKAVTTPGIISVIFSELMMNNVNIMEALSCVPEMLLFVKEDDLMKSYSVLFSMIKE